MTTKTSEQTTTSGNDLRQQAGKVRDDVSELTRLARQAVRDELGEMREGARSAIDRGKRKVGEARDRVDEKVAERPLTSLAIATGVGLLLGLILFRRKSG